MTEGVKNEVILHLDEQKYSMKVALVCIARDEDHYVQEWLSYHLKLGFDTVFIYENNWRCSLENDQLVKIPIDGQARQRMAYNHFIQNLTGHFEWTAFFDVDEFLVLKNIIPLRILLTTIKTMMGLV